MTLKEWLKNNDISATELARRVGCSVPTITRAAENKTVPNSNHMRRIIEETGGDVRPNDFFCEVV